MIYFVAVLFTSSCTTVRPYQRAYLSDKDMKMECGKAETFELAAMNYREGSVSTTNGKTSGGCGCN